MNLIKNNSSNKEKIILLKVDEAATYLSVSVNTLYQWRSQGKIPYVKLHGRLLFDLNDLNNFIQKCTYNIG